MTGKSNTQLLIENPAAMRRFCDSLEQCATWPGIEVEIQKLSSSLRMQLRAARACGLDAGNLIAHCREKPHELLLVLATAVGTARGKRMGKEHAQDLISEARSFGVLQASTFELLKPRSGT